MIEHIVNGETHFVTPLTEKAAKFLNTFVGRTVKMTARDWRSVELEMASHGCWVMGSNDLPRMW